MARTAAALGLVISTQTAKAAEKFVDNSKLLGLSIQGIGNVIAAFFLPGMAKSSDAMLKWVVDGNIVAKTAEVIVRAILFMGDNFLIFATLLGGIFAAPIISAIASMGLAFVSLGTSILVAAAASAVMAVRMLVATAGIALVGGAVLALTGYLDDFLKKVEELSSNKLPSAKDVFDGFNAVLGAVGLNTQSLTKDLKDLGKDGAASAKAVSDALKGLKFDPNSAADAKKFNDELLKLGLKARELKGDFDGLAPGFVQAAVQFKLIKDTGDGFVGTVDTLNPKMLQLNNALLNVAAGQLTKDSLTPWDEYTKKVDLVNRALQLNIETSGKAGISAAVAADQSNKAWSKAVTTLGTALADAAGNFATFFNQFAQGNKEMFIIGKAFSISQALINSYVAFTKALASLPPPFNYVAAAAVLAAGIAMVAKIIAEKPPGAAKGGSFMVPGGSMSVDTKLVPMALAPGERVERYASRSGRAHGERCAGRQSDSAKGLLHRRYRAGNGLEH